jgi:hypothetical protein
MTASPINPFRPTAGKRPPVLVGRDRVFQDFQDGLDYGPGAPGRLMRITGTRGTGKTVVLTELGAMARERGWTVLDETASPGLGERLLDRLVSPTRWSEASVKPSVLGVSLGEVKLRPERLPLTLREALGTKLDALEKKGCGILITIDEVQGGSRDELRALATAFQHLVREDRSVALVLAGLPNTVSDLLNDDVLTFLRRATPEALGKLGDFDVTWALGRSFTSSGMAVASDELAKMVQAAKGYPYMVQLVGYHVWQTTRRRLDGTGTVTGDDVEQGVSVAVDELARNVVEPVLSELSPTAVAFLLAMAHEPEEAPIGAVAARMGKTQNFANTYRTRLLDACVIEPAGRGRVAFQIPYLREYLTEHADRVALRAGLDIE